MKILSALAVWLVFSGLGFLGLPLLHQTARNFIFVCIAVLGGPITGLVHATTGEGITNILPIAIMAITVILFTSQRYFKRRALWVLILTEIIWAATGVLFSVGIYA